MTRPAPTAPTDANPVPAANAEDYLLSVLRGRPGLAPALLRAGLSVLAPVYSIGLKTYLLPYDIGIRKRFRLPVPVICVGNLTTGGTGKTPMTQTLCRHLQNEGKRVVVLNRGYGGQNEYGCAVVSNGERVLLTPAEVGDEAALLAASLPGVPVVVGKDRRVTGRLACERFAPDVIVLDDGLQFWQLHRDLNIVLLNACEPFDNGWTFPRGLLREPPSHLKRAGIVVLTNAKAAGPERIEAVIRRVARLAPAAPVFTADLVPDALLPLLGREEGRGKREDIEGKRVKKLAADEQKGKEAGAEEISSLSSLPSSLFPLPCSWLRGRKIAALSAIGNPASFESLLTSLGGELVARFRFRDHAALSAAVWQNAANEAKQAGAEALIVTQKDAVKLPDVVTALPCFALHVTMRIAEETAFFDTLAARCPLP